MIITGKVIDSAGTLIPNAHIVTGKKGTVTNFDGVFTIDANEFDTIQVSHVGMQTQSFKSFQMPKVIQLQDSGFKLDEVIIKSSAKVPLYKKTNFKLGIAALILGGLLFGGSKAKNGLGYARVEL